MMFDFLKRRRAGKSTYESADVMLMHKKMNFAATEAYKLLRTNLTFMLPDTGKCRIIGVTSSIRSEGKSTTSINLSYTLAETGKRVLVIDGDLRLPSVAKKLELSVEEGLSNLLVGMGTKESLIVRMSELPCWHVLPSGHIPPDPVERLGSAEMKALIEELSGDYDFIVIDLPPVNIVSDALAVAELIDGMLVVVRDDYSTRRELHKCIKQLELSSVRVLGFVVTSLHGERSLYSKYKSRYYRSRYYKHYGDREADTNEEESNN